jgi:thioredoxin 1
MSLIKDVSEESFEQDVLRNGLPVIVHFWAPWSAPSSNFTALETIAQEYQGRLSVVKIDINTCPFLSNTYDVRGVPTFVLFSSGNKTKQETGPQTDYTLHRFLERGGFSI